MLHGRNLFKRYQDTLEQIELADRLGFDNAWLAELHFAPGTSITPSPLLLAAAAAQRTSRIRLGVAVNLIPLHNPIKVAEDMATLDVLSNGRAEFGVGRGAAPDHFKGYNIPIEENRDRFVESLEYIIKAWTHDEFSFDGKYYTARDLRLTPKPIQKPYPPVRIASNSDDTFELVGKLGHSMFATPVIVPRPRLRAGVAAYRRALTAGGHPANGGELSLAVPVYVAESPEKVRAVMEPSMMNYVGNIIASYDTPERQRAAAADPRLKESQRRFRQMTYEGWCDEVAAYGHPFQCTEKLRALEQEFGPGEITCWFNPGGLIEHSKVTESMELFAREVMPLFR